MEYTDEQIAQLESQGKAKAIEMTDEQMAQFDQKSQSQPQQPNNTVGDAVKTVAKNVLPIQSALVGDNPKQFVKDYIADAKNVVNGIGSMGNTVLNIANPIPSQNTLVQMGKGAVDAYQGNKYGRRSDGSLKGSGFLGELKRPDGSVSTELSIGVNMGGKEVEIPSLVPTLTQEEVDYLLGGGKPTREIVQKAVDHAKQRISQGQSPFANDGVGGGMGEVFNQAVGAPAVNMVKSGWDALTHPREKPVSAAMTAASLLDPALRAYDTGIGLVNKLQPAQDALGAEVASVAAKHGIEMPASAITGNKGVQGAEALASKGFFGKKVVDRFNTAKTNIKKIVDDAISKTDSEGDLTVGGRAVLDGVANARKIFNKEKDALYDQLNQNIPARLDNTVKALEEIVNPKDGKSLSGGENLGYFKRLLTNIKNGKIGSKRVIEGGYIPAPKGSEKAAELARQFKTPQEFENYLNTPISSESQIVDKPSLPMAPKDFWKAANEKYPNGVMYEPRFGNIKKTRTEVGAHLNSNAPLRHANDAALGKLYGALSEDMDATVMAQGSDVAKNLDQITQYYKQNVNILDGKLAKRINANKDTPSNIVPLVTSRAAKVEDIVNIKSMLGENVEDLQAAVMGRVLKKASTKTSVGELELKANGLATSMNSIGLDKLGAILTKEQMQALKEASTLQRGLSRGSRIAEGSQTTPLARIWAVVTLPFSNPALAAKVIATDLGGSKFVGSKFGNSYLSGVTKPIPKTGGIKGLIKR